MGSTIKSKRVSYGTVEIRQSTGGFLIGGTNYSIYVNGRLRKVYKTYDDALRAFNNEYY